jgi:PAS domain S-box-containing protein
VVSILPRWAKQVVEGGFRLHRLNIGPRLTVCFLLIILAMLLGNGVLLWQFHQAREQAERLAGVDQELIAVLEAHTSLMSFYERLDVLAQSQDTILLLKQIETLQNAVLEDTQRARNALSRLPPEVPVDPTLLPTLLAIQGELPAQLEAIATLAKSGAWDALRLRLSNQVRPLESRSAALVETVDREVGEQRAEAVLNIRQAQRRIFLIVLITAAITLLFAAFLGSIITHSITQPLGRLVEGATALARGNFSHRVPATGNDEITRLGAVFNDTIVRLQEVYRELQTSETYLAEAQKLSRTGSFGWDISSERIYWSEETFRIFEFEPKTAVTVDAILARIHPEDRPILQQVMERASRDRIALDVEHRLQMPDGSVKYLRVVGHPSTDKGNRREFVGAVTDITDRKRAQEALAATERELRSIINTIPTTAWTARADGYCDFLNQRWLDYAGLTAEQTLGWGWAEAIHPGDRKGIVEYWQSCLASGTPMDTEARMRRYDGAYRWFLFRANPLRDEGGNISKWYGTNIDIEDRKRGEEALHARELSWRQIVDNIPGLVATTGAMGEVEFLNWQTLEFFGKTTEELKNWSLIGAVHPDDLPRVIEARTKSIEAGQIYEVEHRCRRADGVYRWFQVRGLPVRNPENKITAWYLLLTDIDDRKKAEEALQSSERNLRLITDVIPTFIHVLQIDGSVLYVNQAVLDYTGLTLEDVRKEDYRARVFHPDDAERLREERRESLTRAVPFEYEQRVLGKNGEYRWFLIRYNPLLDEQGRIDRWYVASFDIEDRKRAEAKVEQAYLRLAEAQRLSKTGSFITDLVADEHDWSEEAFRIFEFDPANKVTVQMIRDMVHPEDLPSFDAVIARGMTGMDVDFVFRIVTSRAVKHVRGMAHLLAQIGGRPLFIGALQDVTESKVAEEALDRARSELAHVARITTLNAFTASIAHEVNQPLSGIITNASTCLRMLNGDPPNIDGARETARRTLRDGNRASDVITRLRALFSKKEFTPEPLDLNEATREVLALSLSDLQRNRVISRSELAGDLPPVIGDRIQLQQVILNLLRNASDAMTTVQDRPRELLIRTQRDEEDRVRLAVKDVGVGFDPQAPDKLFEAFYTTKSDGMGIGLSVSRSIIERHHGRLWAEPNDGPGATFSFSIPCAQENVTAAAPQ